MIKGLMIIGYLLWKCGWIYMDLEETLWLFGLAGIAMKVIRNPEKI